jgi:hypothetical protein
MGESPLQPLNPESRPKPDGLHCGFAGFRPLFEADRCAYLAPPTPRQEHALPRTIRIGSWSTELPDWAPARMAIGVGLILLGFLGFLPVLGFWMVPLGLMVLSYDIPRVRFWRQNFKTWWRGGKSEPPPELRK